MFSTSTLRRVGAGTKPIRLSLDETLQHPPPCTTRGGLVAEQYRVEVHKFGGTSVGDAARIMAVARIVRDRESPTRLVVVVSAMAGVTDLLVAAGIAAAKGAREKATELLEATLARHLHALEQLQAKGASAVASEIRGLVEEALDLIR